MARNAFAFKQQCDIAYRTLRSLAEQYNLAVATSEDTKRTQTDKGDSCRQSTPNSSNDPIAIAEAAEVELKEPELLVEVEYLPEVRNTRSRRRYLCWSLEVDIECLTDVHFQQNETDS